MVAKHTFSGALGIGVVAVAIGAMVLLASAVDQPTGAAWQAPPRAARKKNPVPSDQTSIAAGQATYVKECRACHGDTGKGDGPNAKDLERKPGDLSKPSMWEQTDGALFWKVTEGNKPMPSYAQTLTDQQRWEVVNYLRTLAPKPQEGGQK